MSKKAKAHGRLGKLNDLKRQARKIIGVFQGNQFPCFNVRDQQKAYEEIIKDRLELFPGCRFIMEYNPFATNVEDYIVQRLKTLSLKDLKSIARDYIVGLEDCSNKTYYVKQLAYRLQAVRKGVDGSSKSFRKNWSEFSKTSTSEIDDLFGRMYGTGKTRRYKTILDKRNKKTMAKKEEKAKKNKKAKAEKEEKTTKKGKKGKKPKYDAPKRGRPAAGEPTLSGTIIKGFSKGRGMTREAMMEHLTEEFPTRDPEVMSRSLSVYMSSTFKKKFDITTDSKGRIKFTPKEEEEETTKKKSKKKTSTKKAKPEKAKKKKKSSDDDEDDDDEDEEEEKPKKKKKKDKDKKKKKDKKDKKKKKKKKVVDDDDDDEDDDD